MSQNSFHSHLEENPGTYVILRVIHLRRMTVKVVTVKPCVRLLKNGTGSQESVMNICNVHHELCKFYCVIFRVMELGNYFTSETGC